MLVADRQVLQAYQAFIPIDPGLAVGGHEDLHRSGRFVGGLFSRLRLVAIGCAVEATRGQARHHPQGLQVPCRDHACCDAAIIEIPFVHGAVDVAALLRLTQVVKGCIHGDMVRAQPYGTLQLQEIGVLVPALGVLMKE